jgi:TRAP-type uncharacterized transport system substrate-binding protein
MQASRAHGTLPTSTLEIPAVMRSRIMLEVASELVAADDWPERQARIQFRNQGDDQWQVCLFGSDAPSAVDAVSNGEADFAIVNPGAILAMALRGAGPFKQPVPVRAITVLPQFDQFGFGVLASTGLNTLDDLRDRRYPLKLSLRGQSDHSVHAFVNEVFSALGFSIDDLISWGGQVRYDRGMPWIEGRMGAVRRGEVEAMFDEALPWWADEAVSAGMRFLSIGEQYFDRLQASGMRRVIIPKAEYPALERDVPTVDFSGWPVFCLESTPDERVRGFCAGLEARKDRIPWTGEGPLPLQQMCRDTDDGPLTIPLHPAAERFWKEQGYLS